MANFPDAGIIKWLIFSPMTMIFLSLAYLSFVYFIGPQFMKNRQPYSLKTFMQFYNIFQIIANFWLVSNIYIYGRPIAVLWKYCESFDEMVGSNSEKVLQIFWGLLILKIIDYIETIVFVLRKKNNQISFLHVYHHLSTVLYVWVTLKYWIHSHLMTITLLNCFVHVVMYSYYFLSTFPNLQRRFVPFKKWITRIQMAHILFLTAISLVGFRPSCGNKSAKYFSAMTFLNGTINLLFFFNFYTSYKKSKTA